MTEVKSKSELIAALARGETEFYTTNENLLYGSALVAKFKKSPLQKSLESFKRSLHNDYEDISVEIGATIVITAMVLATAIALYAIFKDYDVEVDLPNGIIKATKQRHRII